MFSIMFSTLWNRMFKAISGHISEMVWDRASAAINHCK